MYLARHGGFRVVTFDSSLHMRRLNVACFRLEVISLKLFLSGLVWPWFEQCTTCGHLERMKMGLELSNPFIYGV